MIVPALVLAACNLLVFCLFGALATWLYRREKARLSEALREWVTAPSKDIPSPLAALMDDAALLFAARLAQQLKAMLAGVESGESKGEQADMIAQAASGSPWLALLSGILPKRIRNQLMKNPQMIGALSKIGGNHSAAERSSAQRSFEL